eukprot:304512-Pelagomonas_calceolata.AAC.1
MLDENVSPAADQPDFLAVGQPLVTLTRHNAEELASQLSCHALQPLTKIRNNKHQAHITLAGFFWQGAMHFRAGGGESTPAGAWLTATRLTL